MLPKSTLFLSLSFSVPLNKPLLGRVLALAVAAAVQEVSFCRASEIA